MGGDDNYFYEPLGGQLENHASLPGTALWSLQLFTVHFYTKIIHHSAASGEKHS